MADKYLNPAIVQEFKTYIDDNDDTNFLASKNYVDEKTAQATETTLGTIKLNPNESVQM